MNTTLLATIQSQILGAVSATTTNLYRFDIPPSVDYKNEVTITYSLQNVSNESTFESINCIQNYNLQINLNAPKISDLGNLSIYIQNSIQALPDAMAGVGRVHLNNTELFWDDVLEINTYVMQFDLIFN